MKSLFCLCFLMSCLSARANICWNSIPGLPRPVALDEPYQKGAQSQKLDIFIPASGQGPFWPVLVIHGGCFQGGSKSASDVKEYIERLTSAGYAAVSVEYRMVDAAKRKNIFPAAMEDVQDSVRWLRLNGARFKLRTEKIVAFGFSAGSTLAAYLGTRPVLGSTSREDGRAADDKVFSRRVSAVVGFFGRMDFMNSRRDREPVDHFGRDCGEQFVGESRNDGHLSAFAKADVISHIDGSASRFLIGHGTSDSAVAIEHSELLFATLQSKGRTQKDKIVRIVDADHGFSKPGEMDLAWTHVCDFLTETFHAQSPVQAAER